MKSIPQRTLRNEIARVLRNVEAGERLRVTVDGRPVADLIPIERASEGPRRHFLPWSEVLSLLNTAPLDPDFQNDIDSAAGARIDEL